jgi:hypothetical protein
MITTIWVFFIIILTIIFLYFLLKNNNDTDVGKLKLQSSASPAQIEKARNCLASLNNITIPQLIKLSKSNVLATRAAIKYSCVKRGYDFECENGIRCWCYIADEIQCDNYRRELSNPNYYTPQEIEDNKLYKIYWDNNKKKCIKALDQADEKFCDTLYDSTEAKVKYPSKVKFPFKRGDLDCNDDYCDIVTRSTCLITEEYCDDKGLDFDGNDCRVSDAQKVGEWILGEDFIRCAKSGNADCAIDAINFPMAIADIICVHVSKKDGGCGFPGFVESWKELINYIGPHIQEAFEKGWEKTRDWFQNAAFDIKDWFEGDFVDFWTEDIPNYAVQFFNGIANDFKDAGNKIYDDFLVPVGNWFMSLPDSVGC